jgi:hypothetical protein
LWVVGLGMRCVLIWLVSALAGIFERCSNLQMMMVALATTPAGGANGDAMANNRPIKLQKHNQQRFRCNDFS